LIYVSGPNRVDEFSMSAPYDIASAVATGAFYTFNTSAVYGSRFSVNGSKLFTNDYTNAAFYQHTTS
jgi:hypothetical protein